MGSSSLLSPDRLPCHPYIAQDRTVSPAVCGPQWVMLISVPAKIAFARLSFTGLTTSHHFLGFVKYPRGEPASLNSSHYCLASSTGPAPVASSANQHCFAVLQLWISDISGCKLNAYINIARGSPCVVPSADWSSPPPTPKRRAGAQQMLIAWMAINGRSTLVLFGVVVPAFIECFLVWRCGLVKGCFVRWYGRQSFVDAGGNVLCGHGRMVSLAVDVL